MLALKIFFAVLKTVSFAVGKFYGSTVEISKLCGKSQRQVGNGFLDETVPVLNLERRGGSSITQTGRHTQELCIKCLRFYSGEGQCGRRAEKTQLRVEIGYLWNNVEKQKHNVSSVQDLKLPVEHYKRLTKRHR